MSFGPASEPIANTKNCHRNQSIKLRESASPTVSMAELGFFAEVSFVSSRRRLLGKRPWCPPRRNHTPMQAPYPSGEGRLAPRARVKSILRGRGREFWIATVGGCERSELTQASFATRRGLSVATRRPYRLRRARKASVSFVPVRVTASTAIDGLGALVGERGHDSYSGHLYVFVSRRGDRMKILTWSAGGIVSTLSGTWFRRSARPRSGCPPGSGVSGPSRGP